MNYISRYPNQTFPASPALLSALFDSVKEPTVNKYPYYNILKISDDEFRIEISASGFKKDEISIETSGRMLTVKAAEKEVDYKTATGTENFSYIYKGIAKRAFTRQFNLTEYAYVDSATYEDGILAITIKREIPEEKKPKIINIT